MRIRRSLTRPRYCWFYSTRYLSQPSLSIYRISLSPLHPSTDASNYLSTFESILHMLSTVLAPFGSACRVCCAASRRHLPPSYPRNDFRLPLHVQRRTRLAHNCLLVALLCCHPWSAQPTVPQPTTLSLPCSLALSLSRYLTHYLRLSRGCSHHSHNPIQSTLDHRIQQYTRIAIGCHVNQSINPKNQEAES